MKEESSSQSMSRQLFETYVALDNWHTFRLRLFIEGIFVGIFGGLCISLFRFLLGEAEALRIYAYNAFLIPAVAKENFIPLCLWAAALVVTGFLLYRMCLYAPMAGGSGIPQVKGVILGLYKMKWFRFRFIPYGQQDFCQLTLFQTIQKIRLVFFGIGAFQQLPAV